jgi:hypothetical protein
MAAADAHRAVSFSRRVSKAGRPQELGKNQRSASAEGVRSIVRTPIIVPPYPVFFTTRASLVRIAATCGCNSGSASFQRSMNFLA